MRAGVRLRFLDEVRGLAILAVMLRHAFQHVFPMAGVIGVVTFFTLSGYLISAILIDEYRQTQTINLKWFYAKRAIRLLPAMLFFLAVWSLFQIFVLHNTATVGGSLLLAITYLADFHLPLDFSLGHLWTLSTEEQFYLIWPALLLLGLRRGKVGRVLGVTAVVFEIALVVTLLTIQPTKLLYNLPTSWAISLLVGAAAYFYFGNLKRPGSPLKFFPWLILAAMVASWIIPIPKENPVLYTVVAPLCALLTAALIITAQATNFDTFRIPGLVQLGKISYAVYLWNYPVAMLTSQFGRPVLDSILGVVLTLGMATASWWLVERPASKTLRPLLGRRLAKVSN
jgi:peptidoglycan/LPS O-acetylase OafA/YrhL